jgi:hypothetical protein
MDLKKGLFWCISPTTVSSRNSSENKVRIGIVRPVNIRTDRYTQKDRLGEQVVSMLFGDHRFLSQLI